MEIRIQYKTIKPSVKKRVETFEVLQRFFKLSITRFGFGL